MAYADNSVGLIVKQPVVDTIKPVIEFTLPAIEVAVGTVVDAQYLIDENEMKLYDAIFGNDRNDITDVSLFTVSTIDTVAEGICSITIDAVDLAGNEATQKTIMIKVSNTATRNTKIKNENKDLKARIDELEKQAKTSNKNAK